MGWFHDLLFFVTRVKSQSIKTHILSTPWKVKINGRYPKVKTSFLLFGKAGQKKKTGMNRSDSLNGSTNWRKELPHPFFEVVKNTAARLFNDRCPLVVHGDRFKKSNVSSRHMQK